MAKRMNEEIRQYRASMFMGLTLRQTICSGIAIVISVWIYLRYNNSLGQELISWLCILGAAPFALIGFLTWHGMPAEKAIGVILGDLLFPHKLIWKSTNYARLANKSRLDNYKREVYHRVEYTEEHPCAATGAQDDPPDGAGQHPNPGDL